jgi:hypothetical protein
VSSITRSLLASLSLICYCSRFSYSRGLRLGSTAARFLGLRVRIPVSSCSSVSCEWCVLSGRGLCDGPITRPEESYPFWRVWVWSWSLDNVESLAHQGVLHRKQNFYSASGAQNYCENRRWRSWDPELSSAWAYSWAILSPGNISRKTCESLWPF